jgi:hypothetical protein
MKPLTKHLIPGLAAMAALGAAASIAAAAQPDLQPVIDNNSESANALATNKWFVETSASGAYSVHLNHSLQIQNNGPDELRIVPGAPAGGTATFQAVQNIAGEAPKTLTGVTVVGVSDGSDFNYGVQGLVNYTLTPSGAAAIPSSVEPICWFDGSTAQDPEPPETFTAAGCNDLPASGAGFVSGISALWSDAVTVGSKSAYFDITNVAPGPANVSASLAASVADSNPANNSDATNPIGIPGVTAAAKSANATAGTAANVVLSATIVNPQVPGRIGPSATPAPATSALTFAIVSGPANGTASISGANLTYTPRAGVSGTDTVTYYAQDSRGLRSAPATVTFTVTPATGGGGGGGGGGGTVGKVNSGAVVISIARTPKKGVATRLTVKGVVKPARGVRACTGRVKVSAVKGSKKKPRTVASTTAKLRRTKGACRYTATLRLKPKKVGSAKTVRVRARFLGTAKVKPRNSATRTVRVR